MAMPTHYSTFLNESLRKQQKILLSCKCVNQSRQSTIRTPRKPRPGLDDAVLLLIKFNLSPHCLLVLVVPYNHPLNSSCRAPSTSTGAYHIPHFPSSPPSHHANIPLFISLPRPESLHSPAACQPQPPYSVE